MYIKEFEQAIDRTKRIGLNSINLKYLDSRILSNSRKESCKQVLSNFLSANGKDKVFSQCINVNYELLNKTKEIFQNDCFITLGYVDIGSETFYQKSENDLNAMLKSNPSLEVLDIHVWLTLPTMEIIDYTLPTTLAMIHNWPDKVGDVFTFHSDEHTAITYHPMIVGREFIEKATLIRN